MSDLEPEPNCEVKVFDVTTQPLGLTTKSFLKNLWVVAFSDVFG